VLKAPSPFASIIEVFPPPLISNFRFLPWVSLLLHRAFPLSLVLRMLFQILNPTSRSTLTFSIHPITEPDTFFFFLQHMSFATASHSAGGCCTPKGVILPTAKDPPLTFFLSCDYRFTLPFYSPVPSSFLKLMFFRFFSFFFLLPPSFGSILRSLFFFLSIGN